MRVSTQLIGCGALMLALLPLARVEAVDLNREPFNEYRLAEKKARNNRDYERLAAIYSQFIKAIEEDDQSSALEKRYAKIPFMQDKARALFLNYYHNLSNKGEVKPGIEVQEVDEKTRFGDRVRGSRELGTDGPGKAFCAAVRAYHDMLLVDADERTQERYKLLAGNGCPVPALAIEMGVLDSDNIDAHEHLARLYSARSASVERVEATEETSRSELPGNRYYKGELALAANHLYIASKWGYNAVSAAFAFPEYRPFANNPQFLQELLEAPNRVALDFTDMTDPFINPLEVATDGGATGPIVTPDGGATGSDKELQRLVKDLKIKVPQLDQALRKDPIDARHIGVLAQEIKQKLSLAAGEVQALRAKEEPIADELVGELDRLTREYGALEPRIKQIELQYMVYEASRLLQEMNKALLPETEDWALALEKWREFDNHIRKMRVREGEFAERADELAQDGERLRERAERLKLAASIPIDIVGVAKDTSGTSGGVIIVRNAAGGNTPDNTIPVRVGEALVRQNGLPLVDQGDQIILTGIEIEDDARAYFQYQEIKFSRSFSRRGR